MVGLRGPSAVIKPPLRSQRGWGTAVLPETGLPVTTAGTFHGFLHRQKKTSEILKSLENER